MRYFAIGSQMTLWRWLHDKKLDFPKPTKIRKRNKWKFGELRRARERMERVAAKKPELTRQKKTALLAGRERF